MLSAYTYACMPLSTHSTAHNLSLKAHHGTIVHELTHIDAKCDIAAQCNEAGTHSGTIILVALERVSTGLQ